MTAWNIVTSKQFEFICWLTNSQIHLPHNTDVQVVINLHFYLVFEPTEI